MRLLADAGLGAGALLGSPEEHHQPRQQFGFEFRVGRPRLTRNPDDSIDVDGRLYLEELEKELGFELLEEEDRDEADTVGGLIFTLLDRVPNRGEKVRHPSGVEFEILDADPRRIKRIRVRPTEASAGDVTEQPTG